MSRMKISFEAFLGLIIILIIIFLGFNFKNKYFIKDIQSDYILNLEFNDIGSLSLGSNIKINGVSVGEVSSISLNKETYAANVSIVLDKKYNLPIDSLFTLSTEGLIGGSYINIIPGSENTLLQSKDSAINTVDAISLENIISDIIFNQ